MSVRGAIEHGVIVKFNYPAFTIDFCFTLETCLTTSLMAVPEYEEEDYFMLVQSQKGKK